MRRNNRKPGRDSGLAGFGSFNQRRFSSSPREMHKATCADCGENARFPSNQKREGQFTAKSVMLNISVRGFRINDNL